jgi:hypothetical protein
MMSAAGATFHCSLPVAGGEASGGEAIHSSRYLQSKLPNSRHPG